MDNKTYRELAVKTESPIDDRLRDRLLEKRNIRLLHCIMGLGSELEELKLAIQNGDRINIGEEIADGFWYLALGSDELNFIYEYEVTVVLASVQYEIEVITNTISSLLDILKKMIFYGKEYPISDIETGLNNIYIALIHLCVIFKLNPDELKRKNIDKLAARYGDRFSEYLAINRNLEKEYAILSG